MSALITPEEIDPRPHRRPSGNLCYVEPHTEKNRLACIGWTWHDGAWRGACEEHATVIPPWQSGDWRHAVKVVR